MSINLENVVFNDSTWKLFTAAARTGEQKVLDELDALSYMIYLERFNRCGAEEDSSIQTEICRQRVRTSDSNFIQLGWNTERDVMQLLRQFPDAKQQELQNKAKQFMDDAQALIQKK